jgi:hypothetical protein
MIAQSLSLISLRISNAPPNMWVSICSRKKRAKFGSAALGVNDYENDSQDAFALRIEDRITPF